MKRIALLAGVGALVAGAVHARALDWPDVETPTPGPTRVIGRYAAACIAGAVQLPLEGPGYQAVDLVRNRHWGHPDLIAFLTELGRRADEADLGTLLIGDMAQPRGGPMPYGHVSHQSGLDVDVWYRLDLAPMPRGAREGLEEISFVDHTTGRVDPERWTDRHAELVHLAAVHPRVSRIFVDGAIKRDLCARSWTDRSWLRRVRPYPRHDDHMHVRLRCPEGATECVDQRPPPPGEGCDDVEEPERIRLRPRPVSALPSACRALMRER